MVAVLVDGVGAIAAVEEVGIGVGAAGDGVVALAAVVGSVVRPPSIGLEDIVAGAAGEGVVGSVCVEGVVTFSAIEFPYATPQTEFVVTFAAFQSVLVETTQDIIALAANNFLDVFFMASDDIISTGTCAARGQCHLCQRVVVEFGAVGKLQLLDSVV